MSLGVAFRAFFAALFNSDVSVRIEQALAEPGGEGAQRIPASLDTVSPAAESKPAARPPSAARSDALTLLSTLQREARLLDLIQEPLEGCSDEQIGAAAREVLKDSRQTLQRLFAIQPLSDVEEGDKLSIAADASPNRLRLVGKSSGSSGTVAHRGWKATSCEVPQWNGSRDDAMILAPTEIEVD